MQNDLISRSAAIEAVTGWDTEPTDEELEYVLGKVPAVDAVPVRHGRWEAVENTGLEEWCAPPIRCSNCCKTIPDVGADFCPFCGQMNAEVCDVSQD